jgi:hypothetical protein
VEGAFFVFSVVLTPLVDGLVVVVGIVLFSFMGVLLDGVIGSCLLLELVVKLLPSSDY